MAASSIDLTTIAAAAAYIGGIDGSDPAVNDLLQTLVTSASAFAMSYCSRDFRQAAYTDKLNGLGTQRVMLRVAPVQSITSVTIDTVAVPARDGPGYGYVFDDTGVVYVDGCYAFRRGWQNVVIAYTAGWVTPGQAPAMSPPGTITLPMDMQQAIIETVALKYKAQRNNIGIAARQIAGETISYSQADIPKSAVPVFEFYSRVGVWS